MNNIGVSVLCITYNQEDYIEQAIKSFLAQKTDFAFEILIHDDASTDGTAQIVRKYERLYPNMIRAIIQTENQHSKGVKITSGILTPLAKGKYIAVCEGDDFWTDENKLQKQYNYMEQNPECSMCIHDGWIISADEKIVFHSKPLSKCECIYGIEDAIMGLGIQAVTNSFFYRTEIAKLPMPEYMRIAPTGDYGRAIENALHGYIYYCPEKMSAHRMLAKNSFSSTMGKGKESQKKWETHLNKQKKMMDELDKHTEYKYTNIINAAFEQQCFNNYLLTNNTVMLKEEPFRTMLKNMPLKAKIQYHFPFLFKYLQRFHYWYLEMESKKVDIYKRRKQ